MGFSKNMGSVYSKGMSTQLYQPISCSDVTVPFCPLCIPVLKDHLNPSVFLHLKPLGPAILQ